MARIRSILSFLGRKKNEQEAIQKKLAEDAQAEAISKQNAVEHTRHLVVDKIRAAVDEMIDQARINAKQAFIIDQMVTSLEELSLMVKSTTSDVGKVLELALESKKAASDGEVAVNRVVTTIENVLKSNSEISKVTEYVQTIAKESKIISINAMVEAARTEMPSFMVVAKKVQELSGNARESAVKIDGVTAHADQIVKESQLAANSCNIQLSSILDRSSEVNALIERLNSTMISQSGMLAELSQVISGVRSEIQVASLKLEKGIMTMPELLDAIEGRNAEAAERAVLEEKQKQLAGSSTSVESSDTIVKKKDEFSDF